MRRESKIKEITAGATIAQMENALDTNLSQGYELVSIFNHDGKTYAVLVKDVAA